MFFVIFVVRFLGEAIESLFDIATRFCLALTGGHESWAPVPRPTPPHQTKAAGRKSASRLFHNFAGELYGVNPIDTLYSSMAVVTVAAAVSSASCDVLLPLRISSIAPSIVCRAVGNTPINPPWV